MSTERKKKGSKHRPSLLSWRKRKRLNARSERGSQKWWWEVACPIHGVQTAKGIAQKSVKVGVPPNTRIRHSGCPQCAGEATR